MNSRYFAMATPPMGPVVQTLSDYQPAAVSSRPDSGPAWTQQLQSRRALEPGEAQLHGSDLGCRVELSLEAV